MPTDEALALGIQQGRREALAELVQRHHGPLIGFLYRMTNGNRALAEDLAQESFLRVLRGIGGYRYPRPFKPWLYTIAVNLARDFWKQADTRRRESHPRETLDHLVAGAPPPDARLIADEAARAVARALAALPEAQREAVILRFYQELSLAEVAEVLAVPVGTVKSRLHVGLRRLKTMLEEVPHESWERAAP